MSILFFPNKTKLTIVYLQIYFINVSTYHGQMLQQVLDQMKVVVVVLSPSLKREKKKTQISQTVM